MAAGQSARLEAERQTALADAYTRQAEESRTNAARYLAASVSEKRTAQQLAPLTAHGYYLLPDRQWPGSRRAQVDLVVVGPSGVFIVDTKNWRDFAIAAGHVFRDQADVTDDFDGLADLAWSTEAALAEIGLAPGEVRPVVVFDGRKGIRETIGTVDFVGDGDIVRYITSRGQRMSQAHVEEVLQAAIDYFPIVGAPAPVAAVVPEPVLAISDDAISEDALLTEEEVNDTLLEGLLAPPIEDWMAFLHPSQARLVRRSFSGPSRIRGAAGTGKTVVGLHRAAYLARSRPNGNVLVTTYVRTLPAVLHNLLRRMAPETAERVEFSGIHAFAKRVLDERGIDIHLESTKATIAMRAAWAEVGANSALAKLEAKLDYWEEEIEYVIKGRGLTHFDQYANCARPGRKRRLTYGQRRSVWELYGAYTKRLREQGIHDFADLILFADRSLQQNPLEGYCAVIVDEAQDLSCAMVRMLWSLVGDGPDAFTLIGDGQQSIYPGGYTLSEVGINLAGRGVVLDVNYRNTAEILRAASAIIEGDSYTDIEDAPTPLPAAHPEATSKRVARHGPEPVIAHFATKAEQDTAMVARIRAVTREFGTGLGDVAVLAHTNWAVDAATRVLETAGIPVLPLDKYEGLPRDAVKVGTIKRAKGLEFKQVLLPAIDAALLAPRDPAASGSDAPTERQARDRRELYVGMTRARDGVWIGSTTAPPRS